MYSATVVGESNANAIDRMGGSIRVRSRTAPGKSGTCFSLFLPNLAPA
jgi:hypothetical protein